MDKFLESMRTQLRSRKTTKWLCGIVFGAAAGYAYRSGEILPIVFTTTLLVVLVAAILAEAYIRQRKGPASHEAPSTEQEKDHTFENILLLFLAAMMVSLAT